MKIVTVDQMRQIEQECARHGLPTSALMENAGKAFAEEVKRILGSVDQKRIAILVGPGNNGGDGLVAARYLSNLRAKVTLFLSSRRPANDLNLELVQQLGITSIDGTQENSLAKLGDTLTSADVVIDALFGTGRSRPLTGTFTEALNLVIQAKKKRPELCVIALDLPSGLNADTGAVDPVCPYADYTVTLGFPKPGLFKFPGAERVGKLSVVDIGIPAGLTEDINLELITDTWAKTTLPERPPGANKGTFGRVLVVAGSINYIGAAYLACSAAMRVGAGLVTLATAKTLQPILAARMTEVTYLPLPESEPGIISSQALDILEQAIGQYDVLLIGCGLGQSQSVADFLKAVLLELKMKLPALVIDADALNFLAKIPGWWRQLTASAVITPHPGEMARLASVSVNDVQSDRVGIARRTAMDWGKTVVLKGAYTVIAAPSGQCRISPIANPGLASAGTGDILAGAISGLLAQGLPLFDGAALGVYLHGKAGDMIKDKLGDTGMIASDLLPVLPLAIKQLRGMRLCF